MNLIDFLSGPVAEALGWTLLHALWQGFALVLPASVLLHLLRNKSSNLRYRVSAFTLLTQLIVSVATFVWYYQPVRALARPALTESLPANWQPIAQSLVRQPLPWQQQIQQFLEIHLSQFVLVYLIGVALFGVRLAGGWVYLQRLSRSATPPSTTAWTELADTLRSALAVRTVVRVRESARIAVPMVVGVMKPVLLLPIGLATSLSVREVEAVMAHELAHIKRHDYAVNLLQSVMEVLYFFHPALWWLSARVREEREHCCDDLAVVAIGGNARMLAQALARVEEVRLMQTVPTPALAMAFANKRQHLLHRVQRMLGVPTRPFVSNASLGGLTLATLLLVSVSVYAVQQNESQPKPNKAQSKASRRHKVDGNTEFGFTDNQKIDYVIWKRKKLPAAHLARIQRQYDQVMAGKLSLDSVKQPDRDILLTIIETNNPFEKGMDALAEGLGHIDYDNIVASTQASIPDELGGTLAGLDKIILNDLTKNTTTTLPELAGLSDSLNNKKFLGGHRLVKDSLPDQLQREFQKLQDKYAQLQTRLTDYEQAIEAYSSKMKEPARNRRFMVIESMALQDQIKYMRKQADRADLKPINKALLSEISTMEENLSDLHKRIDELTYRDIRPYSDSMAKVYKRLSRLRDSIRISEKELIELIPEDLSAPIVPATPARPAIPARPARPIRPVEAPSVVIPVTPATPVDNMIEYEYDLRTVRPTRARSQRTPRPPRPPKAPNNVVVPTIPDAPDQLDVPAAPGPTQRARGKATPKIAPAPRPAEPAAPATAPKAKPAGKSDGNQSSYQGRFQKLGQFVDSDSSIKSAVFTFKPVAGQTVGVTSMTFVKTDDTGKQKSPVAPTVKIIGAPKK